MATLDTSAPMHASSPARACPARRSTTPPANARHDRGRDDRQGLRAHRVRGHELRRLPRHWQPAPPVAVEHAALRYQRLAAMWSIWTAACWKARRPMPMTGRTGRITSGASTSTIIIGPSRTGISFPKLCGLDVAAGATHSRAMRKGIGIAGHRRPDGPGSGRGGAGRRRPLAGGIDRRSRWPARHDVRRHRGAGGRQRRGRGLHPCQHGRGTCACRWRRPARAWVLGTSGLVGGGRGRGGARPPRASPWSTRRISRPASTWCWRWRERMAAALPARAPTTPRSSRCITARRSMRPPAPPRPGPRGGARAAACDLEAVTESGRDGHTGAAQARRDRLRGACAAARWWASTRCSSPPATEHIALTHRAFDRRAFATGAVRAALWANGRPPGLYSMMDVLGMR